MPNPPTNPPDPAEKCQLLVLLQVPLRAAVAHAGIQRPLPLGYFLNPAMEFGKIGNLP